MPSARICSESGFTLVELIVALALTALVSLILLQGVGLTTTGVDRLARRADRLDAHRSVEAMLRHTLESASAIPTVGGEAGFVGKPASLKFLSLAEDGGPGLYRIELGVDQVSATRSLYLIRRLAMPFAEPRAQRSVLAPRLRVFDIAYFGAWSPADAPVWHDRWEGVAYLPRLVRITLDTGDGEERPPIVVRLWNAG